MDEKKEQLDELVEEHVEKKEKKKKLDPRELSKNTKRRDY